MDYVKLGSTGLEVSKLCLGCMSYGDPERGGHPWALPEDQSAAFLLRALDAGVNFFDTANVYSNGSSEEILGSVLLKEGPARRGGHRNQGLRPGAAGPQRQRAVA